MAFTPAGMFYLSNEDLAPSMDMMGGGIRGMLGVQNEEEAIMSLAKNYDITDLNQREDFFAAVRQINPRTEVTLRKEAQDWDKRQKDLIPTQSSSTDYKNYLVDVDQGYTKTFADWRLEQEPNKDNRSTKEKTMDMAAKFHPCAINAGGWKKSNDECKAKVRKTYIQLNREDADEKGRGEGAKLEAKDISTTQTAIYTDSDNSRGSLATIDQSIGLLDQMYSGTGGESIKSFKSFLVSIGLADKDSNAQSEQFMRNSMQSITDWIQKTKGSISDKEMDAFVAASPNLYNTKAGNMLILQTMKEAAAYNIRLEKEWNRWIDEAKTSQRRTGFPPQMSDWRMNLEQWYRVNKVKLPTQTEIEKASKNSDSSSESTSSSISTSSSGLNYTVEKIQQ